MIDANTGKTIFHKTFEFSRPDSANVYPSPCLAGTSLFIGNDAGETLIVQPSEQSAVVALSSLPHGSGATPTFSGHRMFIRGGKLLYCISAP